MSGLGPIQAVEDFIVFAKAGSFLSDRQASVANTSAPPLYSSRANPTPKITIPTPRPLERVSPFAGSVRVGPPQHQRETKSYSEIDDVEMTVDGETETEPAEDIPATRVRCLCAISISAWELITFVPPESKT